MFQRLHRHNANQIPPGKMFEQMFGQRSIFFIAVHSLLLHIMPMGASCYPRNPNSNSPTTTKVINNMLIRILMTVYTGSVPYLIAPPKKGAGAPYLPSERSGCIILQAICIRAKQKMADQPRGEAQFRKIDSAEQDIRNQNANGVKRVDLVKTVMPD